jgi:hypothetical protein
MQRLERISELKAQSHPLKIARISLLKEFQPLHTELYQTFLEEELGYRNVQLSDFQIHISS